MEFSMEKLMKRYALTRQGAIDFIICTIVTTIQNIMLMAPVAILYYITSDLISDSISKSNNVAYVIACVIMLVVMGVVFYFQYNTSFFSTYIESEHRRINLAEKLREALASCHRASVPRKINGTWADTLQGV